MSGWPSIKFSYLCDMTRATRSRIFCGHDFLNIAPRFSGDVASEPSVSLRGRFDFDGEARVRTLSGFCCCCDEGPETPVGSEPAPRASSSNSRFRLLMVHGCSIYGQSLPRGRQT